MAKMTAKIKIEEIKKIKELTNVLYSVCTDGRVPLEVREEFMDKVNEILEDGD